MNSSSRNRLGKILLSGPKKKHISRRAWRFRDRRVFGYRTSSVKACLIPRSDWTEESLRDSYVINEKTCRVTAAPTWHPAKEIIGFLSIFCSSPSRSLPQAWKYRQNEWIQTIADRASHKRARREVRHAIERSPRNTAAKNKETEITKNI